MFFPLLTGGLLLAATVAIKWQDRQHTQCRHDTQTLLRELEQSDLWTTTELTDRDELLFLASSAAMALYRARPHLPEWAGRIDGALRFLARWVVEEGGYPQWRNHRDWDKEVFFLAHAGATIAHYQLATGNTEVYAPALRDIGEHLGQRLRRGRYKHLISRPSEEFFRPADNAAALYTLGLYDRIAGKNYLPVAFRDWSTYLAEELYYEESRLPCAAFSATDRCQLAPSATVAGLYIAYRAAAGSEEDAASDIPWQEWMHYFKETSLSPFSVTVRYNMRSGEATRFCDQGAIPLECQYYERAAGLWAAAEYEGDYTYFRLFSGLVLRRWLFPKTNYQRMTIGDRRRALTRIALQTIGTAR